MVDVEGHGLWSGGIWRVAYSEAGMRVCVYACMQVDLSPFYLAKAVENDTYFRGKSRGGREWRLFAEHSSSFHHSHER